MTVHGIRRSALIMLASCAAAAALAETSRPHDGEFVMLDQPAVFYMNPNSGSLKESVQKGQQLVWHLKDKLNERRFQLTNMSVGFLRSETGGQNREQAGQDWWHLRSGLRLLSAGLSSGQKKTSADRSAEVF